MILSGFEQPEDDAESGTVSASTRKQTSTHSQEMPFFLQVHDSVYLLKGHLYVSISRHFINHPTVLLWVKQFLLSCRTTGLGLAQKPTAEMGAGPRPVRTCNPPCSGSSGRSQHSFQAAPHPGVQHVGTAPLQGLQIHPEGKHQHRFWHLPIPAISHKIKTQLRMKTKPPVTPSQALCQDWNPKGLRVAALWDTAGKAPLCLQFFILLPELWR